MASLTLPTRFQAQTEAQTRNGSGDKAGAKGAGKSEKRTNGTAFYNKIAKMLEAGEDISDEANIVVCGTCPGPYYHPPTTLISTPSSGDHSWSAAGCMCETPGPRTRRRWR